MRLLDYGLSTELHAHKTRLRFEQAERYEPMKYLSIAFIMMVGCSSAAFADYDRKEPFARISRGQAHMIARRVAPGYVKNSDLDLRSGMLRWKVETKNRFGFDHDVFIDAMSGRILGVRADDD